MLSSHNIISLKTILRLCKTLNSICKLISAPNVAYNLYFFVLRDIFERVIHVKLSSKKMKSMFKRYLEFERKHGTSTLVEGVKKKAKAFVEAKREEAEN